MNPKPEALNPLPLNPHRQPHAYLPTGALAEFLCRGGRNSFFGLEPLISMEEDCGLRRELRLRLLGCWISRVA